LKFLKKIAPGDSYEVQAYILVWENALRQSLLRIAQLQQKVNELEAWLYGQRVSRLIS